MSDTDLPVFNAVKGAIQQLVTPLPPGGIRWDTLSSPPIYPVFVVSILPSVELNDTPTRAATQVAQIKCISAVSNLEAAQYLAPLPEGFRGATLVVDGWDNFDTEYLGGIPPFQEQRPGEGFYYHRGIEVRLSVESQP